MFYLLLFIIVFSRVKSGMLPMFLVRFEKTSDSVMNLIAHALLQVWVMYEVYQYGHHHTYYRANRVGHECDTRVRSNAQAVTLQ